MTHPVTGLTAEDVTVSYGPHRVLDAVTLHLDRGETVGLSGPSGSGKSTLVRVLALLHRPDHGRVRLEGTVITGIRYAVPATVRTRIAVLFQSPRAAADPRLRLADIIAEPLRAAGRRHSADHAADHSADHAADRAADRAHNLADLVGLTSDLLTRQPHEVSDGQLQRACLARALIHDPTYLLCDEATVMLDASTQAHVAAVIRDHQQRHRTGVLLVSHDQALLRRWADRVIHL